MVKYSPGPWKAHLNVATALIPGHIIKMDDDIERPIASLWEGGGTMGKPEQIANAKLVAAAPELLEALIEVLPHAETIINKNHPSHKKALAAIKKATL